MNSKLTDAEIKRRLTMSQSDYNHEFGPIANPLVIHSVLDKNEERHTDRQLQLAEGLTHF